MIDNIDIIKKETEINNCTQILKKEFVGIDNVIDQIMINVKAWYMFPNLIDRPLVINLWGMTGCGKTSLVNRITELLNLKDKYFYYNLGKLNDDTANDIEYSIERTLGYSNETSVFVFDEFQFAATFTSNGSEKETKTSLKSIWELIDVGKIYKDLDKQTKRVFEKIIRVFDIIRSCGAVIKDGVFVNAKSCFNKMKIEDQCDVYSVINSDVVLDEKYNEFKPLSSLWCDLIESRVVNDEKYYLSSYVLGKLYECSYVLGETDYSYDTYIKMIIKQKSFDEIIEYTKNLYQTFSYGYKMNYEKSLIFVIGNVDEAYSISYDLDPDMDADQFKSITEKLTVIDIREALQHRFRNEQISRLGSIHILYPSFSINDFEKIIENNLNDYAKLIFDKTQIKLHFDSSVVKMIYKDSVFPTQGVRPIFTSIYEIIKTKIPNIILECINRKMYNICDIYITVNDNNIIAKCLTKNGELFELTFNQNFRIDNLRNVTNKEQQCLVAVHESGHFVLYTKLTGKLPAKLLSVTAASSSNGFMLPDRTDDEKYKTMQEYMDEICVALGGYVAEYIVFGKDNMSSGSVEDLKRATTIASDLVRNYGGYIKSNIYNTQYVLDVATTTYLCNSYDTDGGKIIKETEEELSQTNDTIRKILNYAVCKIQDVLKDSEWNMMFVQSCEYLKDNNNMPKEKMAELYNAVSKIKRESGLRSKTFFVDTLNNYKQHK